MLGYGQLAIIEYLAALNKCQVYMQLASQSRGLQGSPAKAACGKKTFTPPDVIAFASSEAPINFLYLLGADNTDLGLHRPHMYTNSHIFFSAM